MSETVRLHAFADEVSVFIDEQIRVMKKNRIAGLELRSTEYGDATKIRVREAKEIRKKLEDAGLFVWSVGSPVGKTEITKKDETWFEAYKHALEIGEVLGASRFRLFSFYIPRGEATEPYRGEVIERLGRIMDYAKGSPLVLCHENETRIYGETAERCLEILKALPGLRAVFDAANFVQCDEDTLKAWDLLHPYVDYLHVKDSREDKTIVPSGQGHGHVPEIVGAYLRNGGRDFTLEPHLVPFDALWKLELSGNRSEIPASDYKDAGEAFTVAAEAFRSVVKDAFKTGEGH